MKIFNKNPFLIAAIGFNFIGIANKEGISEIDAAKLMIDEAKACGADAVMFQSFKLENIISNFSLSNQSSDLKQDLANFDEFGFEEYHQLADYCREVGIKFLSTPLDFESADYLDEFIDVYKISSLDLTNIPLIRYVASKNKPILLSTGASTLREINEAVKAIEEVSTVDIAIMHCVLSQPTEYEDANLLMIRDLSRNFPDYEIGYSDYTKPDENMVVLTTAYNYGATILEKYFTLDKTLEGYSHICSMDSKDVYKLRDNLSFLSKINGHSNKQPLICESLARKEYRKSIVAKMDIRKGDVFSESNITFKMPGIGISPSEVDEVIGKTANEDIAKGSLIFREMLD